MGHVNDRARAGERGTGVVQDNGDSFLFGITHNSAALLALAHVLISADPSLHVQEENQAVTISLLIYQKVHFYRLLSHRQ